MAGKKEARESVPTSQEIKRNKRTTRSSRKFPFYTIEEAIKIPTLIKARNSGNPWDTGQLAIALNMKRGGNVFYYLTAASRDYGFTSGTRDTATVYLEELGKKFVNARSSDEAEASLRSAFGNIDLFNRVREHYKDRYPADDTLFKKALKATFAVDEAFQDDFIRIFRENVRYAFSAEKKVSTESAVSADSAVPAVSAVSAVSTISTVSTDMPMEQPSTDSKQKDIITNKIFVIMPCAEKTDNYPKGFFNEVLEQLIKPSAEKAGCIAETACRDDSGIIHSAVVQAINNAPIILADLTEQDPHVLFGLGIAIALKKPVVIIKSEDTGQMFDIDNSLRIFSYNQNLWPSTLAVDVPKLSNRISAVMKGAGKEKPSFEMFAGT